MTGRGHRSGDAARRPPVRSLLGAALTLAVAGTFLPSPVGVGAAPGAPDAAFGDAGVVTRSLGTGNDGALAVAVQPDGRIVTAGFTAAGADTDFAVTRFDRRGHVDFGFGSAGTVKTAFSSTPDGAHAHAVAVQPDGRIVAGGGAGVGAFGFALARYRPDGSVDESWDTDGLVTRSVGPLDDVVHALAVQPDGKVVAAGGAFRDEGADADFAIARFRMDGRPDAGFGTGGSTLTVTSSGTGVIDPGEEPFAHAVALQPDGRIVTAGSARVGAGLDFGVVRYTATGAPDPTFGGGDGVVTTAVGDSDDEARAVVVLDDGRIVVAGWTTVGSGRDVALARYNADGTPDTTFGPGTGTVVASIAAGVDQATGMIPDAGGKVVVSATALQGGTRRMALARFLADGGLDPSFGTGGVVSTAVGATATADALARRDDGSIVVVGSTTPGPEGGGEPPPPTSDLALAAYLPDPAMSVGDVTLTETDDGQTVAFFPVTLSDPAGPGGARAAFATADDTASAADDYRAESGTVTIAEGATRATVEVAVRGDRRDEATERFVVRLSGPEGAVLDRAEATGTIVDDEERVIDTVAGAPALFERILVLPPTGDDEPEAVVLVRLCVDPHRIPCADFSGAAPGPGPNPRIARGSSFLAGPADPPASSLIASVPGGTGLAAGAGLEITLPTPSPAVELTFAHVDSPPRVVGLTTAGEANQLLTPAEPAGSAYAVRVPAGGARTVAQQPFAVAAAGDFVYVADPVNHVVRFVDPQPRPGNGCPCASVFAGNGARGAAAAGADPLATELAGAYAIAPKATAPGVVAEMYVADTFGHRVLRVVPPAPNAPAGTAPTIAVVAGTGALGFSGDGGPAGAALLNSPYGVAHDDVRRVTYVADTLNHRVRAVGPDGTISTVAGDGTPGFGGDGGPGTAARLNNPRGLALDAAGNLYVADTFNHAVRRLDPSGIIVTVAGTGTAGSGGDGGAATAARLDSPAAVAVDVAIPPNVFVADTSNHRVRRVDGASGVVATVAGTGDPGFAGDGGDARSARLASPFGVAVRADGEVLVADTGNARVRVLGVPDVGGVRQIRTLAGNGTVSHPGDPVTPASSGQLAGVSSVATWVRPSQDSDDPRPRIITFLADPFDHSVKMIDRNGRLHTVAGDGRPGYTGDGGPAAEARLFAPFAVALDRASPPRALFVADTFNHVIRRIDLDLTGGTIGTIRTVAGRGEGGDGGDGGPATSARLSYPTGVAVDRAGELYVADAYNARIRRIDGVGGISTLAGSGRLGFSGDGGPATQGDLYFPLGVAVDDALPPNVYVADSFNHRVRRVDAATKVLSTVVGTGAAGDGPDGVHAGASALRRPWGVAAASGASPDLLVADSGNHRVRRVDGGTRLVSTIAAAGPAGRQGDLGPAVDALVSEPRGVHHVEGPGVDRVVMVADSLSSRVRQVGVAVARIFSEPRRFDTDAFQIGCTTDCIERQITISNRSHNTLRFDQLILAGAAAGDYRVSGDGCSRRPVAPSDGCTVVVAFSPTSACPGEAPCRNAVLRLVGNGGDSAREVRLLGWVETPTCFGRRATIVGTTGGDVLAGTDGADVIHAGPGDDVVEGRGGDDVICGGDGGDVVDGGAGNDLILGGAGDDALFGNADDDVVLGEDGADRVDGGVEDTGSAANTGDDILLGGDGDDALYAPDFGFAYLAGERGDDSIRGFAGADTIVAGSGDDGVNAGAGDDRIWTIDGVEDNDGGDAGAGDDRCFTDPDPIESCETPPVG